MALPADIQAILTSGSVLLGVASQVTLATGEAVSAYPGVATLNDTGLGSGQLINGTEKTLRFLAEKVPGLITGSKLRWNQQNWVVMHTQLTGQGLIKRVFLLEDK